MAEFILGFICGGIVAVVVLFFAAVAYFNTFTWG